MNDIDDFDKFKEFLKNDIFNEYKIFLMFFTQDEEFVHMVGYPIEPDTSELYRLKNELRDDFDLDVDNLKIIKVTKDELNKLLADFGK